MKMGGAPYIQSAGGGEAAAQRAASSAMGVVKTNEVHPAIGHSIDEVREEIDEVFKDARRFHNMEPDQVFRLVSGHSARLAELRGRIQRIEAVHRVWASIRTKEIEPALDELMKQYQFASRLLTMRELDWKMETGGR